MHRRELLRILGATPLLLAASRQAAPRAGFTPDVELSLTAAPDEVAVLTGTRTRVWRFSGSVIKGPAASLQPIAGSFLGPTIRLRTGQKVRIRFTNHLPEPSIVHWHGLDVPEVADGHPRLAIASGKEYIYDFEVTNRAGTYWYHPHPHMRTANQVYNGLAGLLIVNDAEEDALALPSGDAELLCVLQDRQFDAANQLVFRGDNMMEMMNGFLGDQVLVSGQPRFTREVDAAWHRVRLLNGSNARFYKLAWSHNLPMLMIGGEGGLHERAIKKTVLTLAPGQRADLLLDLTGLAANTDVHLDSLPFPEADAGVVGMMGMMGGRMGGGMGGRASVPNGAPLRVMTLHTRAKKGPAFKVPDRLCAFGSTWAPQVGAKVRRVPVLFQQMQWSLGGRMFDMNDVAPEETVAAGSTQVWEFMNMTNGMGMQAAHPIHVHGRQFRVLSRSGGHANALREGIVDEGWKDTVIVLPGETVRAQITFTKHPGLYLYHCHILEHEDMGMMRNFRVV